MKKMTVFVAALSAFVGLSQALPYSAWTKYRDVTINTTATGANVASSQTNFPVLVRLTNVADSTGANVLSEALSGGADIRFSDSTGAIALPYEIDTWSASAAAIWVKVPSVAGNGTTKIRLYWNRSGATAASDGPGVFNAGNGYIAVWHLGVNGAANRPNSTGNSPAVPMNFAGDYVAPPGVVGMADTMANASTTDATIAKWFDLGNSGYDDFTAGITYSVWAFPVSSRNYARLVEFSDGDEPTNASNNISFFRVGTNASNLRYEHVVSAASAGYHTNAALTNSAWNHYAFTVSGASVAMYKNGAALTLTAGGNAVDGNTSNAPIPNVGRRGWLGRSFYPSDAHYTGKYDEVQLSRTARSADWVKLHYELTKSTANAVTLGAAVTPAAPTLSYITKSATYLINQAITANTAVVSGAATGWSILPALPAGLSFSTVDGSITGTPTAVSGATQYVVSATVGGNPASDTLSIAVTAGTPPGAPTGVNVTGGNAQVTVTWAAPSSQGTSAITSYLVRAVNDTAKTCTWTTGALSCTVTGLTNGTAYTFVVRAVSAVGPGAFSTASASVTPNPPPTPPSPPLNVTAAQAGTAASVTVTWSAPASTGGQDVSDYYVTASPGGLQCYGSPFVTPLSCTVTGLSYNTAYTFTVIAANPIGSSSPSAPSNSVTPVGILQGPFAIQVTGSAKPFTFALTPEAMASTEALTMTISDVYGRTVWSKTVNPKTDLIRELRWNSTTSTGRAVSAGVYMVRVSAVSGGQTSEFIRKAVSDK